MSKLPVLVGSKPLQRIDTKSLKHGIVGCGNITNATNTFPIIGLGYANPIDVVVINTGLNSCLMDMIDPNNTVTTSTPITPGGNLLCPVPTKGGLSLKIPAGSLSVSAAWIIFERI